MTTLELRIEALEAQHGTDHDVLPEREPGGIVGAVELALESGAPGRISTEHVTNVLGRLNAPPPSHAIATPLRAAIAPLADTARYDRLREAEVEHAS